MKKFSGILLTIGLVLLAAGFGIQLYVSMNPDMQSLNRALSEYGMGSINPQTVGEMLKSGISFYGYRMTVDDLLSLACSAAERSQYMTYLRVYAATPTMVWAGVIATLSGLVLAIRSRRS